MARAQVQGFVAERETTTCLLTDGAEKVIPLRMGELENQLPGEFLRVQRSYIINAKHIARFEEGSTCRLYLEGRAQAITVGRKQRTTVRNSLSNFGG